MVPDNEPFNLAAVSQAAVNERLAPSGKDGMSDSGKVPSAAADVSNSVIAA